MTSATHWTKKLQLVLYFCDETLCFESHGVIFDTFLKFNLALKTFSAHAKNPSWKAENLSKFIKITCLKMYPKETLMVEIIRRSVLENFAKVHMRCRNLRFCP